jgi:hypothetical protein
MTGVIFKNLNKYLKEFESINYNPTNNKLNLYKFFISN